MKIITAGESHGKALIAIIEGLPAHLSISLNKINADLALRQKGYGRGARQEIECDKAEILTGVRNGETLGSPLTLCIYNKDYANWEACMSAEKCSQAEMQAKQITAPRSGHADLTGMLKFQQTDARNILERASARETAIRVAAGSVCKQFLSELGVEIAGYVKQVCDVKDGSRYEFNQLSLSKATDLGMLNRELETQAKQRIDELRQQGDTAGGAVEIRVKGFKRGFGSCMSPEEKLDGKLAHALMSIQAIKGVAVGDGFEGASQSGKAFHDEIFHQIGRGFYRQTNRAGGIEGGMSNGEEIVLTVMMKPIPTLQKGLQTVDYLTKKPTVAAAERSDTCAIFALEIIAEAVVAQTIAAEVCRRVGGDTMSQVKERYFRLP